MDTDGIQMKFQWRPGFTAEMQAGFEKVQFAFSQKVTAIMDHYVPFDTGTLKDSVQKASDFKNGILVHNTPYARKQYYLHEMGTHLHSDTKLRGSYWGQRAVDGHKEGLIQFAHLAAQSYLGGRK